jgi:hypothetical protein
MKLEKEIIMIRLKIMLAAGAVLAAGLVPLAAGVPAGASSPRETRAHWVASYKPHKVDGIWEFASRAQARSFFKAHPEATANGPEMCTLSGTTVCARDKGDVNTNGQIVSGNFVQGGGTAVSIMIIDLHAKDLGGEEVNIVFQHHPSQCWAAQGSAGNSNGNMLMRDCTAYGTVIIEPTAGSTWFDRGATNAAGGALQAITAPTTLGGQWTVEPLGQVVQLLGFQGID